jgi:transposase InsO family protein
MPGEETRRYLYVAIDRCTRWVYHEVLSDKEAATAAAFLKRAIEELPMKITKLLTDNGPEFTDRFVYGRERTPTGNHVFDQVCSKNGIEHRLIPPWHPQTNGMVERYNGRIADQLRRTRFGSPQELEDGLDAYSLMYRFQIPHRVLGHKTPYESLIEWFDKRPDLFRFDPHNLPGLDI